MKNQSLRSGLWIIVGALILANCNLLAVQPKRKPFTDRVHADPQAASMNLRALPASTTQPYRFLVVGHLYGSIQGDDRLPAQTLLNRMPEIERLDARMLVSLGDMVKHSEAQDFDLLDQKLLQAVSFPVFNTVGNHDVENRDLYEERYGDTFYSFQDASSWMIFLDTERENCAIDEPQQAMLSRALDAALQQAEVRQIFIFMHKTLFFQNQRLFELKNAKAGPNVWDCYGASGFAEILAEQIEPAAQQKPVYLFAGDVGASGNLSPYYEQRSSLTMVMTGIGDLPSDSAILVSVEDTDVRIEVYSLTGETPRLLESYSPAYWVQQAEGN